MKKIINTLMHEYFHHVTNVIYDILIDDKETENPAVVDMPGCLFLLDFVQPFFNLRDNNPILPSSDKDMLKIPLNEYQCLFVSSSPALAKDYIEELFQYLDGSNRRFIILYGGQYDSIKQMKTVFHEMESYCSCKFYITQNKIIYMDSLPDTTHELDLIEIWNLCVQIGKLVNRGELAQAEDNLDIVFRKLQEHIRIPISIAKSACNEIAKHCLLRSDIKQSTFIQYLQEIEECTDINELKNIAAGIIHLNSPVDVETSVIQQAIELIHQNYMHNISLESIAAQVYLSPCYFSYLFKKITGTNFIKYLTAYRVEKAKDLLRTTRLKIVDICEQVGYSNSSYFCQIFHNHCGMTPIQYRENKL